MLGRRKGQMINKYVPDYVVFDLETTGVSWKKDRIIEISAVKVLDGKVVDEFSELVNPDCSIPYYASRVNGIFDDMVCDARTFDEVLPDFVDFVGDSILVGHNIHAFDMKFLYRECRDIYGETLTNNYVDTLYLSRKCVPELPHHKLVDMAEYFDISTEGAHRALKDCRMNQEVFERLGNSIKEPLEIERKFLIRYPDIDLLEQVCTKQISIVQTYLVTEQNISRRIRMQESGNNKEYWYNEKKKITDITRIEREKEISKEEFENLAKEKLPNSNTIYKTRYCIPSGKHVFEIDVFRDWTEWAFAEVELTCEEEAYVLPKYVSVIKEVTHDKRYTNRSLAVNGFEI